MKSEGTQKITITLPHAVYHRLRNEAKRQKLSLPELVHKKIQLRPSQPAPLAILPLKEILAITAPEAINPEARLDFFSR
jgi:hypothetical protein